MYKNNFIGVIKHQGRILREVGGEVSLPFGSQYTISLKNVDSRRALVTIEVDGENVLSDKQLIIDGHTTQEIKGFMRDMSVTNCFKFIHKTKEISDYRGDRIDDGLVVISYTFEKEKENESIRISDGWRPYTEWAQSYRPYDRVMFTNYDDIKFTSNTSVSEPTYSCSDEGITVKGAKINQQYEYGYIGTLENKTSTITIKLKGRTKNRKNVTKPLVIKTKLRCSTCGRSSKSNAKFCYNCGTCLE